ncbi:MAG: TonB-dependent receptor [Bacteroidales bacterium]
MWSKIDINANRGWSILLPLLFVQCLANAFSSGCTKSLGADDPPVWPDTIQLRSTTIQATRIAVQEKEPGVYLFTPTEIKAFSGESLGQLLSYSGLIHIKDYGPGNLMTASARGLSAAHTSVEWNGIPLSSLSTGQTDFSLIPLSSVPEIVVQTGTASLQNGKFSPGGTVQIYTNGLLARQENPGLELKKGDFGVYQVQTLLPWQKKNTGARVQASYTKATNDFTYLNPSTGEELKRIDAGYHAFSVMADGTWATGQHLLGMHLWGLQHFREIPQPTIAVQLPGNEWMKQDAFRLSLTDQWILGILEGKTIVGYTYDFFHYRNLQGHISSRMTTHQPLILEELMLRLGKLTVQSQLRVVYQQAISVNYKENPRRYILQAACHFSRSLGQPLKLQGSMSAEKIPGNPIHWHPVFTLEWNIWPSEKLKTYVSAGKTSRNPSFNDLYWKPGGNSKLKPEKIHTIETGWIAGSSLGNSWKGLLKMTAYYNLVNDWIMWLPDSIGSLWSAGNLRKVKSKGLEGQITLSNHSISLRATASYNRVYETGASQSLQLPYTPSLQSSFLGSYQWRKFSCFVAASYTARRYLDMDHMNSLPPYKTIDLGFSYEHSFASQNLEISLKIKNLTNSQYEVVAWQPMPGRNLTVSIIYRYIKQKSENE